MRRAAKQRRKAARREPGMNHTEVEQKLMPYVQELWLDTIDYKCDQLAIGACRYDIA